MGAGAQVVIVNATKSVIAMPSPAANSEHGYQMNSWDFATKAPTIDPGKSSGLVYVEFSLAEGDYWCDDGGEAYYTISDGVDNPTFAVHARSDSSDNHFLKFKLDTLSMVNNSAGSKLSITGPLDTDADVSDFEWLCAKLVICGSPNQYIGTSPPVAWMQAIFPLIQNRTLKHICLPASHDSGMSVLKQPTTHSTTANTTSQSLDIGQQLTAGVRYFDIRACLFSNDDGTAEYGTCHVSNTAVGWQGGLGQAMDEIITQINAFTADNAELLIFDVATHAQDVTGIFDSTVNNFTAEQYDGLVQLLMGVNNRCTAISDLKTDASTLTVADFIKPGQASVLFVIRDSVADLTRHAGEGFITDSQLEVYNKYADEDDVNAVISSQLRHLQKHRTSPDSPIFMAAWVKTLTGFIDNVFTGDIIGDSSGVNKQLFDNLYNACSTTTYPNILQVDGFNSDITALAIAINYAFGTD
ncbi:Fc.00g021120.m01.CDS01 [Cosmosporella sp. VM-42]